MIDYSSIYRKEISKQNLFTFEEVKLMLKPMLGALNLRSFMEMKGYLDYNGFPKNYQSNRRMMKVLYFESGTVEKHHLDPVIFFTKTGVRLMLTQALNYHHSINLYSITEHSFSF
jgi:hypothetical protein